MTKAFLRLGGIAMALALSLSASTNPYDPGAATTPPGDTLCRGEMACVSDGSSEATVPASTSGSGVLPLF
jgi:hypothetical protein